MTTNPHVLPAADLIDAVMRRAAADPAVDTAAVLDDAGLLTRPDPFATPGRRRPGPSPAAVAALVECRKAKAAADLAEPEVAEMPGEPAVTAAYGEVRFVVRPQSLDDWRRWTQALGVHDAQGRAIGGALVARFTYRGVRARLVGEGVPALLGEALKSSARGPR
ncbi:hypothetical protein ACGFWE_13720 [Streptomyces sp. NPDC048523]|uniref:hypothetical protein n=1 Tax=Streptomyces sp. NPDC048523 TaxID=3365567 RepID=UPI00371F2564